MRSSMLTKWKTKNRFKMSFKLMTKVLLSTHIKHHLSSSQWNFCSWFKDKDGGMFLTLRIFSWPKLLITQIVTKFTWLEEQKIRNQNRQFLMLTWFKSLNKEFKKFKLLQWLMQELHSVASIALRILMKSSLQQDISTENFLQNVKDIQWKTIPGHHYQILMRLKLQALSAL